MTTRSGQMHVDFDDPAQHDRFYELKYEVRDRLDEAEVTNGAMVRMMMDVYEHHLESNPGPLVHQLGSRPGSNGSDDPVTVEGVAD